ncbi:MAG: N-acetylmuramoyl-L-alanine amidase [Candidatus Palauibacterales bacterium]|nr:N-acetylmuramoyl-L-alanine amidase [Candidatus Palauibacterales bacterium]MDP2529787.1 N-acetylmuramoyl-L-alanine amidase [Candidatus Palauibacterales bacterium]MDP2585142.1 N-acetylmuramoyl-L-alanine amidase [Candidatus Palauibacterales bacterium]
MASLLKAGARARVRLVRCTAVAALVLGAATGPATAQLASHALTLEDAAAVDSITTLEAARGDGIWDLLQRAGIAPTPAAIAAFKRRNRGRLIHGDGLLAGRSYTVPAGGSRVGTFPIFGSEYARVERESDRLSGRIYYIVSGHGGPDPGTVGRYAGRRLPEDEIAYDVSLRLARRLLEEGATVYLIVQDPDDGIRDGSRFPLDHDERYVDGRRIPRSQLARLRDRVRLINRLYAEHGGSATVQRVLSLHVDARGSRREPQIDVHFLVASRRGRRMARGLRAAFRHQYARVQPGRGYDGTVDVRNLYVLRHTRPVAVLVELGNIRNGLDQRRLTRSRNRQAVADWLVDGLLREAGKAR